MTPTQVLLYFIKHKLDPTNNQLRNALDGIIRSYEEWDIEGGLYCLKPEEIEIGKTILSAWGFEVPLLFWVKVDKFNYQDRWTVGDLSGGPFMVHVLGFDETCELVDLGDPIVRHDSYLCPTCVKLAAEHGWPRWGNDRHLPICPAFPRKWYHPWEYSDPGVDLP